MSVIIVIEIVIGLVVLAAAIRFAVRDTRERGEVDPATGSGPTDTTAAPKAATAPEEPARMTEVGSAETS